LFLTDGAAVGKEKISWGGIFFGRVRGRPCRRTLGAISAGGGVVEGALDAGDGGAEGGGVAEVGEGVGDGIAVAEAEEGAEVVGVQFLHALGFVLGEDEIEEGLLAVGEGVGDGGALGGVPGFEPFKGIVGVRWECRSSG
jgi:hypothetical protein